MLCNWKEQYGNLSINMLHIIIKVCEFFLDLDNEFVDLLQKMRGHDCFYVAYFFYIFSAMRISYMYLQMSFSYSFSIKMTTEMCKKMEKFKGFIRN